MVIALVAVPRRPAGYGTSIKAIAAVAAEQLAQACYLRNVSSSW
jgi:hypothetical protein